MRILTALMVGGAALGLAASTAHAQYSGGQPVGWYIGGEAGWTHLMDPSGHVGAFRYEVRPDEGWNVGGHAGYAFPSGIRLEGELVYRSNDLQGGTVESAALPKTGTAVSGTINSLALMANVYWDVLPLNNLTPYLGAGVGVARVAADSVKVSAISSAAIFNDDDVQPAFQGMAGLKYAFAANWSASLDYRFFTTTDVTFKGTGAATGLQTRTEYKTHNVMLGLNYHFAPPPPPPPAAAPAPAPVAAPAPPPPQARTFIVFFEFDKSTLTPDGAAVVRQAADAYKTTGRATIDVNGYTDLSGTAEYNLGLSKRRADTVRAALVQAGVPDSAIVEAWHGKENPRVPTPDGVREPQNRRVELLLH